MRSKCHVALTGAALAVVLTVTACSGSSSSTPTNSSGTGSAAAGATGSMGADGSPIKVGFINQEKGANTYVNVGNGARAAFQYINENGGIDGHPLDVVECLTDGTPAGSQACGQQIVAAGVAFVFNGEDLANGPTHALFQSAGLPVIGWNALSGDDRTATDAFWFGSNDYLFAAVFQQFATEFKAKKVGYMQPGVAASEATVPIMQAAADKLGMTLTRAKWDPTATDFSGTAAQLLASKPDVVYSFGSDKFSAPLLVALRNAGFDGPYLAGATRGFEKTAPPEAMKNAYSITWLYDWSNPAGAPGDAPAQLNIFLDSMVKTTPDFVPDAYSQAMFSVVMSTSSVLKEIGADKISSSTVRTAMQEDKDRPVFMGTVFNCAKAKTAAVPGGCSDVTQIVSYDTDAKTWKQGTFTSNADFLASLTP